MPRKHNCCSANWPIPVTDKGTNSQEEPFSFVVEVNEIQDKESYKSIRLFIYDAMKQNKKKYIKELFQIVGRSKVAIQGC